MASIDFTTLAVGALIGMGCREQIKTAGRVAATTAASLASVAASAAQQVAQETKSPKSAEEEAADDKVNEINRKIDILWNELH